MTDLDIIINDIRMRLSEDIIVNYIPVHNTIGHIDKMYNVSRLHNMTYFPFGVIAFSGSDICFVPTFGSYKKMMFSLGDPGKSLMNISDYINSISIEHKKMINDNVDRMGMTWEFSSRQLSQK